MRRNSLLQFLLCSAAVATAPVPATALEPLSDHALAAVNGRDGMSFNLNNFALTSSAQWRYTTAAQDASLSIGNLSASRSDNTDAPFADPYRLDIRSGGPGMADVIALAFPNNADGKESWKMAYDLRVEANGIAADLGSVVVDNHRVYGGGMQWSTPQDSDGLAFGLALRSDTASLSLQPNGRDQTNGQMRLSNLRISAADADGNALDSPWRLADVLHQPGIFNASSDSRLHLGIGWPDAGGAAFGTLQVGNLSFRGDGTMPNVDLGASRIGAFQLQYLDIKFHQ
jgi:hypothetical protein